MDAVAAFSLAGTILQFIDTGSRFVALAWKLYQRGLEDTDKHYYLLKITDSLNAVLPELKSSKSDDVNESNLGKLAEDCGEIAAQLLTALKKISAVGTGRRRDALKTAFRLYYKQGDVRTLEDQLGSFRSQLNLHLLLALRWVHFICTYSYSWPL